MTATPALHPHSLEVYPDTAPASPSGEAMPEFGVKRPVESVSCSCDYDRSEQRTYAGMLAADLVEHAKDIEAMRLEKPFRIGSTARFQARVSEFSDGVLQKALNAYLTVKAAMRLIARPLQDRVRREPIQNSSPVAPKVWVTKAPTKAEWAERDKEAGYDVRGTSPTWVLRRAYRHRIRRRLELEPPLETAYRLGQEANASKANTTDFIGPPKPLHYVEVEDLHQIWPPVELPKGPKGMLPKISISQKPAIPCEASAKTRDPETDEDQADETAITHANDLIDGYNFALEQFGENYTCNYLQGLTPKDEALMNGLINRQRQIERGRSPKNKEPP